MEQSAIILGWNRNFLALKTSKTDWSTMEQSAIILGWNRPTVPVLFGILFKQPCEPDCLKKRHGGACLPAVSGGDGPVSVSDNTHTGHHHAGVCGHCGHAGHLARWWEGHVTGLGTDGDCVRGQVQHNFLSFDTVEKPTLQHPVGHWV